MKKTVIAAGVVIALGAVGGAALAQVKPDVLVKQRQSAMTLIGKYFGPLGGMAQGKAPFDAKIVQRNADFLAALVEMPWDGFDPSTKGEKTRARPEVYSDSGKFKEGAERLRSEVASSSPYEGRRRGRHQAQIGALARLRRLPR